jgi:ParB-like chromosome segregation protein Spo0J
MAFHKSRFSTIFVGCLLVTGCDALVDAVTKGSEAVTEAAGGGGGGTPDDKLGEKLGSYITCINQATSSVRRSADRYADWVDKDKGVTGKESYVYGIFEISDQATCIDGVKKSADLEPDDPALEATANEYVTALQAAITVVDEAYKYYDEKNYEDDKFAKAKELHPKLVKAFDDFEAADKKLRELVVAQNDALLERELERIEKEQGQKLRWQQAKLMNVAKKLMEATDAEITETGELKLDMAKFEPAFAAFEKQLDGLVAYTKANKAETDSITMFSSLVDGAEELKKAGKEMARRQRDAKKFDQSELERLSSWPEQVEGSPMKFSKLYDDLVQDSNGLNWSFYKPNG